MTKERQFSKRILLVLSGMSPQVVTGTLYGILHSVEFIKYHPTEIHLIATQGGIEKANEFLLGENGQFARFCKDYNFQASTLKPENVHVITDRNGQALQDIRTTEENEDMADFILGKVRELTADSNSQLHLSISGGRKTMSYFGGYAMTMFGREQDILSHVLVSDNYEFIDEYYYPTPYSHIVKSQSGLELDANNAQIQLANIPYIHLRDTLPQSARMQTIGFKETLQKSKKSKLLPDLKRDDANRTLLCTGEPVKLQRALYGVYTWLLEMNHALSRLELIDVNNVIEGQVDLDLQASALNYSKLFTRHFNELFARTGDLEKTAMALEKGMTVQWLEQKVSRINSELIRVLGKELATVYKIKTTVGASLSYYLDLKHN